MMMKLMQFAASCIKGRDYKLDARVPVSALYSLSARRFFWAIRGLFKGVAESSHPNNIIFVGPRVELRNRSFIRIGGGTTLATGVLIDGLSVNGVNIGKQVNIGPYCQIEATGVITNIGLGFTIGDNSGMGAFSFVGAAGGVSIGKNVIMGQRVSFHSENHQFDRLDIPIRLQGITRKGIEIGDNCWIGAGVIFLDGAAVGHGCVIGAGAVVNGVIPPNSIAVGVPAKVVKVRIGV